MIFLGWGYIDMSSEKYPFFPHIVDFSTTRNPCCMPRNYQSTNWTTIEVMWWSTYTSQATQKHGMCSNVSSATQHSFLWMDWGTNTIQYRVVLLEGKSFQKSLCESIKCEWKWICMVSWNPMHEITNSANVILLLLIPHGFSAIWLYVTRIYAHTQR